MNAQEIQPHIKTKFFGSKIYAFDLIGSTNSKAKALALDGSNEGTIVIADEQTAGRGRLGRTWISERGKNLTFSVIVKPRISPEHLGILSIYAGLAVAQAIEQMLKISPQCKWPNDVLLDGKKFCGILSETVFNKDKLSAVVIGIGINVNQSVFPKEILHTATSLALTSGKVLNRFDILSIVLKWLENLYAKIQNGSLNEILDTWKQYCPMFGKEISVNQNGQITNGVAINLANDGSLLLRTNKGEIKILAGDVSLCYSQ